MVDYEKFANQMRPLCETILNSLKIRERRTLAQNKEGVPGVDEMQ